MNISKIELANSFLDNKLMFECKNIGILHLTGKDSFKFLNGISSNEVKETKNELSISTLILTNKGRILFNIEIYSDSSNSMYILHHLSQKRELLEYLAKYRMSYEVNIEDLDRNLKIFKGHKMSNDIIFKNFRSAQILEESLLVYLVPKDKVESINKSQTNQEHYNAWRILNGVPTSQKELTIKTIPIEANMWSSISFTKGCYIGQETIARIHYRGKIKRSLACLEIQGKLNKDLDVFLTKDKKVGSISNYCYFIKDKSTLALGYIDDEHNYEGNNLIVSNANCKVLKNNYKDENEKLINI